MTANRVRKACCSGSRVIMPGPLWRGVSHGCGGDEFPLVRGLLAAGGTISAYLMAVPAGCLRIRSDAGGLV